MKAARKHSAIALIPAALLLGLAIGARAQSYIFCDNIQNTSTSTNATSNGLFWIMTNGSAPVLIHQDFNAAFYGGTNSTNLSLIASFSGTAAAHSVDLGAGTWIDPTGTSYAITGSVATAFFQIQAWTGNYTNYSAAVAAGAYAAQSAVFSNSVAAPPSPPPDLTGMPAIVLVVGGSGNSPSGFTGGPSSSGGTSPTGTSGPLDASISSDTCGLWLSVAASNTTAMLILHNTRQSETYYVWSSQQVDVAFTNWGLEATVLGASGDTTQTNIAMGTRSNLFFRVTEDRNYVTNTVFQGLSYADTLGPNPDTVAAAGPSQICELLNGPANSSTVAFAVYDKSFPTNQLAHTNINGFFAVHDGIDYPTGQMTDPRILFDSLSQCFVASAIDSGGSEQVILAICTNANNATNLTSGWTRYLIRVHQDGFTSDFDTLGLDANGIYLSVLQRAGSPNTNAGHTVVAIKKPDIYLGTNISSFPTNNLDLTLWTLQPAVNFDSVPSNGHSWFVAKGPPTLSGSYQGGGVVYRRLQWAGTNAYWADANWIAVSSGTNYQDYYDLDGTNTTILPGSGTSAPQSNGTVLLWTVGSRLASPTLRNGLLWTCQAIGLSTNTGTYVGDSSGSNVSRSGMQWLKLQISPDNTSLTLADHGRIYDTNYTDNPWWYYFPSLMVNCAGDMVAGFSGSTGTNYVSTFYTWRVPSGAMLSPPGLIQAGTSITGNRLGDYSATCLDPTDDWSFWTVQEYGAAPHGIPNRWGTVVAKIRPNP